jgi:hypothetical protein
MIKFTPTAENYRKYLGKKVQVRGRTVTVAKVHTSSRGGSWERGFRFSESEWALLRSARGLVSMDHGRTWHATVQQAKRSKGKLRLSSDNYGELAFEGIQEINRRYEGSGYKWRR